MSEIQIWKPVFYNKQIWGKVSTAAFDRIAPSWAEYRTKLNEQQGEYAKFIQKLKYEHSVETGIIERLYDVDEAGVTVTLLKDGITSNFLQHENVDDSEKVYALIRDQYEAIDGIFSYIKNERTITTSFIKELHSVITRSQEFTDAVTPLGEMTRVPLLRGEYKTQENNPARRDGTIFKYCPPVQVSVEMDKLVQIYNELVDSKAHVIIRAAFFHHALTTIHPFQDGNGRVTRLLTCLILIRDGYFPFSVKRSERELYLNSLEQADKSNVQPFADYISSSQIKAIESALSLSGAEHDNLDSVIDALKVKLTKRESFKKEAGTAKRNEINSIILDHIKQMQISLQEKIEFKIYFSFGGSGEQSRLSLIHQMAVYAAKFNYFMRRSLPYEWYSLNFSVEDRRFMITLFTHHFGQTDDVIAIGGVLETSVKPGVGTGKNIRKSRKYGDLNLIPLEVNPLSISLLSDINEATKKDIRTHIERLILVGMAGVLAEV